MMNKLIFAGNTDIQKGFWVYFLRQQESAIWSQYWKVFIELNGIDEEFNLELLYCLHEGMLSVKVRVILFGFYVGIILYDISATDEDS